MSLNIVSWPTFLVNIAMIGNTPEYIYLLFDYRYAAITGI